MSGFIAAAKLFGKSVKSRNAPPREKTEAEGPEHSCYGNDDKIAHGSCYVDIAEEPLKGCAHALLRKKDKSESDYHLYKLGIPCARGLEIYKESVYGIYKAKPCHTAKKRCTVFPCALKVSRIYALLGDKENIEQKTESRKHRHTNDYRHCTVEFVFIREYGMHEEYKRRRDTVMAKLEKIPGVISQSPGGAFYVMAALPVDSAENFQKWMLEEFEDNGETVFCTPGGPMYATPGKGINEIRIAYVLKQEDLERAMDLLALGIEAYNKRNK